ncbi:MAG: EamA family transporter [Actinomycetota bacterium]
MAVALALVTAACFGVADVAGGLAATRARVLQVVAGSHLIGAVGAVVAAVLIAERFTVRDAGLGVLGGGFGMVGVALLYRRLAIGPMNVVAPLTAVTSAVLPAAWGVAGGERLTGLGWLGLAVALVAVVLVSLTPAAAGAGARAAVDVPVVVESLLAGAGFGALFIVFGATAEATAPWPVASARIASSTTLVLLLLVVAARSDRPVVPADRGAWGWIAAAGLLDTTANMTFLFAEARGRLAVVSVLAALYPVVTVVLARAVLGERMTRAQGIGFAAALVATQLLALG